MNIYLSLLKENYNYKKQNISFELYGKKYGHEFEDLKFKIYTANQLKKNIIIGSSTSMTIRPELLGLNYYNLAKGNIRISEIKYVLDSLNYDPENIIILLDPYHFNENFPEISKNNFFILNKLKEYFFYKDIQKYYFVQKNLLIFNRYSLVIKDFKKNFKKILKLKENDSLIGFYAKMSNSGFRYDGSFKYPDNHRNKAYVKSNEVYILDSYPKQNLYFGKNAAFINNYEEKLFFLTSKDNTYKRKILVVLNTVESKFYRTVQQDKNYSKFLKNYRDVCGYLIINDIKCIDRINFAYENNIDSKLFYDPFHFRYELSNNLLINILKDIN